MFADASLAARIDRAEARLCARFATSPVQRSGGPSRLVLPMSGGQAIYAGPASPINKVVGLGFHPPLDLDALDVVETEWRRRDEPVRIELSNLSDPQAGGILTDRGYRLHGFENVLGRVLDRPLEDPLPGNLTIDTLQNDDDARVWLDVAVEAFMNLDGTGSVPDDALPREQLKEALEPYAGIPEIVRYLVRMDGQPAGEAALRIDDGIAQLAGAGTLPVFRGRGIQKALLQRRLNDALTANCDLAVVTTAPGTRSQENVMRRGFVLLYTRAILVRKWGRATETK